MFSIALDLNNVDQPMIGPGPHKIVPQRTLWETPHCSGMEALNGLGLIEIPTNGIYDVTAKIRLKNLVNCTMAELAVYKATVVNGEIVSTDYWFILDRRRPIDGVAQLNGVDKFDFCGSENIYLGVFLSGDSPQGDIDGSDDYTALGMSHESDL